MQTHMRKRYSNRNKQNFGGIKQKMQKSKAKAKIPKHIRYCETNEPEIDQIKSQTTKIYKLVENCAYLTDRNAVTSRTNNQSTKRMEKQQMSEKEGGGN